MPLVHSFLFLRCAAVARAQFLRYVFHEVRVPFNAILLGLEELRASKEIAGNKAFLSDVGVMQSAAETMQAILNDTLDAEKVRPPCL